MEAETQEVQAQRIVAEGLDPICAYWHNFGENKGQVTLTCYGQAWTAYFGAMPEPTIQAFFRQAGADYMANAMMRGECLKKSARPYITRIVTAVKASLQDIK